MRNDLTVRGPIPHVLRGESRAEGGRGGQTQGAVRSRRERKEEEEEGDGSREFRGKGVRAEEA